MNYLQVEYFQNYGIIEVSATHQVNELGDFLCVSWQAWSQSCVEGAQGHHISTAVLAEGSSST